MNHPDGPEFEPEPEDGRPAGLSQVEMEGKGLQPAEVTRDDWGNDEQGVVDTPDTPSDVSLPESLKGDDVAEAFVSEMREQGLDEGATNQVLDWYTANQERVAAETQQHDESAMRDGLSELRGIWGTDLRRNVEHIQEFLYAAPPGVHAAINSARLPNGVPLGSDAEFLVWLHKLMARRGGESAVNYSKDADRIREIETIMKTNRAEYNKDEDLQRELRELYERRGH